MRPVENIPLRLLPASPSPSAQRAERAFLIIAESSGFNIVAADANCAIFKVIDSLEERSSEGPYPDAILDVAAVLPGTSQRQAQPLELTPQVEALRPKTVNVPNQGIVCAAAEILEWTLAWSSRRTQGEEAPTAAHARQPTGSAGIDWIAAPSRGLAGGDEVAEATLDGIARIVQVALTDVRPPEPLVKPPGTVLPLSIAHAVRSQIQQCQTIVDSLDDRWARKVLHRLVYNADHRYRGPLRRLFCDASALLVDSIDILSAYCGTRAARPDSANLTSSEQRVLTALARQPMTATALAAALEMVRTSVYPILRRLLNRRLVGQSTDRSYVLLRGGSDLLAMRKI